MSFIIFIIFGAYCSDKTGLRIDFNIQVPLIGNQYVSFQPSFNQDGVDEQIKPQYKLLANLRNNSQGVYAEMFDFIIINGTDNLKCYEQNVLVLHDVFSCTYYCEQNQQDLLLGQRSVTQNVTDGLIYVVDNTQLPCVNGTFFKLIEPWITVQLLFVFEDASYLTGTIIIILLVTVITIQIMSVIVLYYKLRKYKKKIKRNQEKKQNMGMRSDYQELMEGSVSMQEYRSQKVSSLQQI